MKLTALILLLAPLAVGELPAQAPLAMQALSAQEPAALGIRNIRYDAKKATVDFDAAPQPAKPVHAWLVTVALNKPAAPGWKGTSLVTPLNCSRITGPVWRCQADVDFGQGDASQLVPEVRVSAVLFEDGTAEGDLRLLQHETDDARIRLRALEYWQDRLKEQPACKDLAGSGAAAEADAQAPRPEDARRRALCALAKAFEGTPPEVAYTRAAMSEREIVGALFAQVAPPRIADALAQRVNAARDRAMLFPAPAMPWAPSDGMLSTRPIANRAAQFRIVNEEERGGQLRLVLRNGYDKEIVAFAFTQRQADGAIMRSSAGHAIAPGGLQDFEYGAVAEGDPLELACVFFRDGSADGDPAVIQKVRDGWAGRKAEKARILPLVRAIANLPAAERAAATDKLIADLQAHPRERPDAEHSLDFVLGEQAARKSVLRELRDLPLEECLRELQE